MHVGRMIAVKSCGGWEDVKAQHDTHTYEIPSNNFDIPTITRRCSPLDCSQVF